MIPNGKSTPLFSYPICGADLSCRIKATGQQVDDRIVEVHWDPEISRWRLMRFRDDKPNGNHKSVVEHIVQSIADGVEKDAVSLHR